jgi:cytochrome c oxidase subunit II
LNSLGMKRSLVRSRTAIVRSRWFRRIPLAVSLLLLAWFLAGCTGIRALDPAGPAAALITDLWWFMFWTSLVIFIIVIALLLYAVFKRRQPEDEPSIRAGRMMITWGGIVVPAIVVIVTMVYTLYVMDALAEPQRRPPLTVDITSHMWWWDMRYTEQGIATGNELHIPAGQPVLLQLHAFDVIHSFWVPRLQGKRDMMPGTVTTLWIEADEPGEYRGMCAEFCGLQHANMSFLVIVHEPEDFEAWVEHQQNLPPEPEEDDARQGLEVFLASECVACHTIRGTPANGTIGPDLTDIAMRRELGAGTIPNTPGHLAGWIINAQQFKPGNRMPPQPIEGEDFQALMAYLLSLR